MEVVDLAISDDEGGDCLSDKETSDLQPPLSHQHQNPQHRERPEPQVDLTDDLVQEVPLVPSQSTRGHIDPTLMMKEKTAVSGTLELQQQLEPVGRLSSSDITNEESEDVMLVQDGHTASVLLVGDNATFSKSGTSRGGSGGNSTSGKGLKLSKCPSCSANNIPHGQMFILERCGHGVCPACMVANVTSSSNPVCPVPGCGAPVVVRDLALVLHEDAWEALQARRLAAYRMRVYKGVNCPGCSVWFEASSAVHDPAVIMGRAGQSGSTAGVGCRSGVGTVQERLNRLMLTPQLLCKTCSTCACQFCGSKVKRHQTIKLCGCGDSKLWSASGLLEFLDEIVENPTDVALTDPVENTKTVNGARGSDRGRSSGRGRSGRGKGKSIKGPHGISSKWSKGTGYGGAGDKAAADAAKAAAAEAESRADRAMAVVIDALISCLPTIGEYPEHIPELLAMVRESSLLQVVCAYLRNDSLMDIAKRRELYQSLFNLVVAFAVHELLAPLIDNVPPRSIKSEYESCPHLGAEVTVDDGVKGKSKARVSESEDEPIEAVSTGAAAEGDGKSEEDDEVQEVCPTKGEEEKEEDQVEDDKVSVADLLASANRQAKVFAQAPGAKGKKGDTGALKFALQVTEVHDKVKNSLTYLRGIAEARASSAAVKAITSAMGTGGVAGAGLGRKRKREELDCVEVSLESRYQDELGDSRFKVVPLLGKGLAHHFASKVSKGGIGGRARAVRISQEVSSLATSLPVQPDSSIFLRVDEDRYDVMRALITGPKDTPYEGGCFEFDILLPADYPNRPPQVQFLTTGSGRIRFNPNLYNTGKVCLSLLGTWSGPGWDSKASTLLQVLVSIQSLIFVAEPYFNEPGFESQLGTIQGRSSSRSYNNRIRNATLMFGVVEALEKQSSPMHDVIRRHFRLIKGRLLRTARAWLMEAPGGYTNPGYGPQPFGSSDGGYGGDYTSMSKVVSKVEELLSAL